MKLNAWPKIIANALSDCVSRFEADRLSSKANMVNDASLDDFERSLPSHQNAIDLIPGWNHAFPPDYGLRAGPHAFFEDTRIHWAIQQFGPLEGKHILELGPLEGSHTWMLERAGAEHIDAVEANKRAFLRCLVAKEIYKLKRSSFCLGDFTLGLERPKYYNLIVACGVLYHMSDPVELLRRVAARTDAIYLWTHYFDDVEMPPSDPRRGAFRAPQAPHNEFTKVAQLGGADIVLHQRSYHQAWKNSRYCGGPEDSHYWMEKSQILSTLRAFGFGDLSIAHEEPNHPNGPAFSVFARKDKPSQP